MWRNWGGSRNWLAANLTSVWPAVARMHILGDAFHSNVMELSRFEQAEADSHNWHQLARHRSVVLLTTAVEICGADLESAWGSSRSRPARERPSDKVSDNRHGQRWTPANTHGRSIPGQTCRGAGRPCLYLASGRGRRFKSGHPDQLRRHLISTAPAHGRW